MGVNLKILIVSFHFLQTTQFFFPHFAERIILPKNGGKSRFVANSVTGRVNVHKTMCSCPKGALDSKFLVAETTSKKSRARLKIPIDLHS